VALDPNCLVQLRELLKECVASVEDVNRSSRGSGFFVDEDLLLTCAHVVKGQKSESLRLHPFKRQPRSGIIIDVIAQRSIDLALVKVDKVEGESPQPAVVLDRGIVDNVDYFAVGYPSEQVVGVPGLEEISYRGNARIAEDGSTPILLVLQAGGALIKPGLSGGPVMNTDTGAVVGLVQYTQDPNNPTGGAAIPIGRAASDFAEVRRCLDKPPVATARWRDILGPAAWRQLGKSWGWRHELDICIRGSPSGWEVRLDPDNDGPYSLTGRGLSEDVSEVLFHWAQRRRVRRDEDVKLLGRLLSGALLPPPVLSQVLRGAGNDQLLVRLRFDGNCELFDVPWEFVTIRIADKDHHIATEPHMGLVRVGSHANEGSIDTAPRRGVGTVLGIIVQPEDWQTQMPRPHLSGKEVSWPQRGWCSDRLSEAIRECRRLQLSLLEDPIPSKVAGAVLNSVGTDTPIEVVHYMGFGQLEQGKPMIALSDGEGDVEWRSLEDLFSWVEQSGARLLIIEFFLPRVGTDPEPIPPRAFLSGLAGRVNAIIYTRFPVHPRQSNRFNVALYNALGSGETVEMAVQRARKDVLDNQFLGDAAGFGWFALLTGPRADTQLVEATQQETRPLSPRQVTKSPI
jgi:hypothetical protein